MRPDPVGRVSGLPRNPPVVSMRPQSGRKHFDRRFGEPLAWPCGTKPPPVGAKKVLGRPGDFLASTLQMPTMIIAAMWSSPVKG